MSNWEWLTEARLPNFMEWKIKNCSWKIEGRFKIIGKSLLW